MSRPDWAYGPNGLLNRRRQQEPAPDVWDGKALPNRNRVMEDIHYRIYNGRTGELITFGTSNSLQVVCDIFAEEKANHPDTWLAIRWLDGPSY